MNSDLFLYAQLRQQLPLRLNFIHLYVRERVGTILFSVYHVALH